MLVGGLVAFTLFLASDCKKLRLQPNRDGQYGQIVQPMRRRNPDVIMLGDDITAGLLRQDHRDVFKRYYGDLNAAIAAIPGDTSANTLWLIDQLPKVDPKVVVLQIGANDQRCRWGPDVTAQNVGAILSRAHRKWPDARLVLIPTLPRGSDPTASRGQYLRAQFSKMPGLQVVWLGDLFMSGGRLVGFDSSENLQPTVASQERIGARLGPILHEDLVAARPSDDREGPPQKELHKEPRVPRTPHLRVIHSDKLTRRNAHP